MNDGIKLTEDYASNMRGSRMFGILGLVIGAIVMVVAPIAALWYVRNERNNIYVLDEGSVLSAYKADNGVQKDLEVISHMTRFHELFFNMAPNITTINQNVDRALELADESAYNYYSDLKEQQYFSRLVQANATQQIIVDSVHVNVQSYPYAARTFASVYLVRESNITKYEFQSLCQLTEVTRTQTNPHGLMIGRYKVEKYDKIETRTRQ